MECGRDPAGMVATRARGPAVRRAGACLVVLAPTAPGHGEVVPLPTADRQVRATPEQPHETSRQAHLCNGSDGRRMGAGCAAGISGAARWTALRTSTARTRECVLLCGADRDWLAHATKGVSTLANGALACDPLAAGWPLALHLEGARRELHGSRSRLRIRTNYNCSIRAGLRSVSVPVH